MGRTVIIGTSDAQRLHLPSQHPSTITINGGPLTKHSQVTIRNSNDGQTIADVPSGTYVFVCK